MLVRLSAPMFMRLNGTNEMEQFTVSRNSAILRDAIGLLWMMGAGSIAALGVVAMVSVTVLEAVILLVLVGGVCAVFFPRGISILRAALRLPRATSPAVAAAGKQLRRRFGSVFGVEMLSFLVADIVLFSTHHYAYVVPIILLITGIHFFPLAMLFKMWPYHVTGVVFSLAALFPLFTVPFTMTIGHLSSWIVLPTVGCALGAWVTAGCVLGIERKRLAGGRTQI